MHIALICPSVHGHLNPMTALGRELAHRGHRISLVARPGSRDHARSAGFTFIATGSSEHESGVFEREKARLGELQGLKAVRFTGRLLCRAARIVLRDAPGQLAECGVEAIITDQVSPAGAAIAEVMGLPYVVVCNALALNFDPDLPPAVVPWRWGRARFWQVRNRFGNAFLYAAAKSVHNEVNHFRTQHGLPRWKRSFGDTAGLAQVAQQPAFFDFPRHRLPNHFHYTAPWHGASRPHVQDFPFDRLDGRPLIYASLGTLQNRLHHLFSAIAEACLEIDAQLVLSLGRQDVAASHDWPGSLTVVSFAPQPELISRASLVITHAGLNTVLESLTCGVPMLAIPITNDQPGVARRLEWLGAGEVVLPRHATSSRLRLLIRRLLQEPHYRQVTAELQRTIQKLNGVAMAADVIERAFQTRQAVPRVNPCSPGSFPKTTLKARDRRKRPTK